MINDIKLITETRAGTLVKVPATVEYKDGRIYFLKSPFALKDEIKAMRGSKWHGFDEKPLKVWSIEDCQRNRFQLEYMQGENPYEWFDQELKVHEYTRPLMVHQKFMADCGLTYHFQIWAAEMGVGKTLSAISVMEMSGVKDWIWAGPKSALAAVKREFVKWGLDPSIKIELLTYDGLARLMDDWPADKKPPAGLLCDESSFLKNCTSQRSRAAQKLADLIRFHYRYDGYVILMSGTPSPKTPVDWWSPAEITWPGFLREGSPKALEQRLAFLTKQQFDAGVFSKRIGWKDDERKCSVCGLTDEDGNHNLMAVEDGVADAEEYHTFSPSKNEVAFLFERLKGLVLVQHKKDCLDLPDKRYRKIVCKPTSSVLRVAKAIADSATMAAHGFTLLRELSDGFQYRDVKDGMTRCTHCEGSKVVAEWFDPEDAERVFSSIDMMSDEVTSTLEKREVSCPRCNGTGEVDKMIRVTKEVPCPKEKAIVQLLEENEEQGRLVIFAGFTGSVDRCVNTCLKNNWDVVRLDGRGFAVFQVRTEDGTWTQLPREDGLAYWANMDHARVAFVSHPESGGMGLTLTEARMAVFYSNSFKPHCRVQAEDRIHRTGMDVNLGATIVDLIHLPSDDRTLNVIRENRELELMTMGDLMAGVAWEEDPDIADAELLEAA